MKKILLILIFGIFFINFISAFDWSNSTVAYYKLDQTTGVVVDSLDNFNMTANGTTRGISGLIGNANSFDGGDFNEVAQKWIVTNANFTMNIWVNITINQVGLPIYDGYYAGGSGYGILFGTPPETTNSVFSFHCAGVGQYSSGQTISHGTWQMLSVVRNDTTTFFYVNGVNVLNTTHSCIAPANDVSRLGISYNYGFIGGLDEVGIWNRTLIPSEINELYNSGSGLSYTLGGGDTTPPNVTINSPLNQSYSTTSILFNITAVDDNLVGTCLMSLDGANNVSMVRQLNSTYLGNATGKIFNYSSSGFTPQDINYFPQTGTFLMSQADIGGQTVNESNINGTLTGNSWIYDTSFLTNLQAFVWNGSSFIGVDFSNGGEIDSFNTSWDSLGLNVTLSEISSNDGGDIEFYDGFYWILSDDQSKVFKYYSNWTYTGTNFSHPYLQAEILFEYGGFFWIGDRFTDSLYQYNINGTATGLSFDVLSSGATNEKGSTIYDGKLYLADTSADSIFEFEWNNNNYAYTNSSMSEGSHTANFYCNDSLNNLNNTESVTFFIDSNPPYFTHLLADQNIYNNQSLSYDINATDDGVGLNSFSINWTTNFTINSSSGILTNSSALSVGNHYINVTINDTLNNLNSSVILINVSSSLTDTTPPNISIIYPTNTTYSSNVTELNFTSIDETALDSCWYSTDNGVTNSSTNDCTSNFTLTSNEGSNTWIVYANDTSGNENSSSITFTVDTISPIISNFKFIALNSSKDQIGIDQTIFNFTNLLEIEFMNISFDITDESNISGDIYLYLTANGTNACSLGNNQSTTCYNFNSGSWIQFINGTDTSTFRDIGDSAQGDAIKCSYTGNSTFRNYSCEIDEHYNPNVWKHYPLNFSDIKWQDGVSERISKNTIFKVEVDFSNIPLDADYYKLDFRANYTTGALIPINPLIVYACNSSYTTGDPATSNQCQLISSKLPSDAQDDGTKFRSIFTKNITSGILSDLGDIKYFLVTSNSPTSKYYSMKTYGFLGNSVRSSISNNNGNSYSNLSDGYETELNFNWFYDSVDSNTTQTLIKIYSNDSLGNNANSSIQTLSWLSGDLNIAPVVNIITPTVNSTNTGTIDINWTTNEPNGDSYITNITISNSTDTITLNSSLSSSITTTKFDTTPYQGSFNLSVISCENNTADLLCGNDTEEITLSDLTFPQITINSPLNQSYSYGSLPLFYNVTVTDNAPDTCLFNINNGTNYTMTKIGNDFNYTEYSIQSGNTYNITFWCNDTSDNLNETSLIFTIGTQPTVSSGNSQTSRLPTKVKVLALKINSSLNPLQRAIIYSVIFNYNKTEFTQTDLIFLREDLRQFDIILNIEEIVNLLVIYQSGEIETVEVLESEFKKYNLIEPSSLDFGDLKIKDIRKNKFICNSHKIKLDIKSKQAMDSCYGTNNFNCTLKDSSSLLIEYPLKQADFFSKSFDGNINYTTINGYSNESMVNLNVYNMCYQKGGIPIYVYLITFVFLIGGFILWKK